MAEHDFEVYDLANAEPVGEELSPLSFDKEEYTPFQEFIASIDKLSGKPKRVRNYALSINGKVKNDRMENYLKHKGESSSLLKEALKSPRHYWMSSNLDLRPKSARHFELGTFIHSAILEPDKFKKVHIEPEASRNEILGLRQLIEFYMGVLGREPQDLESMKMPALRAMLKDLQDEGARKGHSFITAGDYQIVDVIRAIHKTYGGGILPLLQPYMKTETSMYGKDPATKLAVKIRPDGMLLAENFGINAIVSVKTTSATSPEEFMRDAAKFRYELAEGMYLSVASHITGRQFSGTLMIMTQTVIPFGIALMWLDAEDLEIGKYKYRQALDIVYQAKKTDEWPGFDCAAESGAHGILQLRFPSYIKSELKPQYLPE